VPINADLFDTLKSIADQLDQVNPTALSIGLITLITAALLRAASRRFSIRLPYLLFGLIVGSAAVYLLDGAKDGVTMLGALPSGLPVPSFPNIDLNNVSTLASGAFTLSLLGLIEAVSIARVIALRSHQQINGNREFIG